MLRLNEKEGNVFCVCLTYLLMAGCFSSCERRCKKNMMGEDAQNAKRREEVKLTKGRRRRRGDARRWALIHCARRRVYNWDQEQMHDLNSVKQSLSFFLSSSVLSAEVWLPGIESLVFLFFFALGFLQQFVVNPKKLLSQEKTSCPIYLYVYVDLDIYVYIDSYTSIARFR